MEHEVSAEPKSRMTAEQYLELERNAETRSEYLDGEMFAMSGVTREHNRIMLNMATDVNGAFAGRPCEVFAADMRVKVAATGLYTYPDLAIVCGKPEFEDDYLDTLTNPQVIVEVLSDSTESYDRGRKFAHYRTVESLQEYVLVSQYECRVERFERREDGSWIYSEVSDPHGSVALNSVTLRIPLTRIYHGVDFSAAGLRRKQREKIEDSSAS
jgi:Uma2 family endonuclease